MGFSAFPDGGRFEALRRTGPGEEKPVAVQVRDAEASVGVASFSADLGNKTIDSVILGGFSFFIVSPKLKD